MSRNATSGANHGPLPGSRRWLVDLAGYTIVELIAVMVLLAALSMIAMSRMAAPADFEPSFVTQTLLGEIRLAQQLASSRRDVVVGLTIDRLGSDWRIRHTSSLAGVVRDERVSGANTSLLAASGPASGNVDAATPLALQFDAAGNVTTVSIGASAGDAGMGIALTLSGGGNREMCIYPSGYVVAASCE